MLINTLIYSVCYNAEILHNLLSMCGVLWWKCLNRQTYPQPTSAHQQPTAALCHHQLLFCSIQAVQILFDYPYSIILEKTTTTTKTINQSHLYECCLSLEKWLEKWTFKYLWLKMRLRFSNFLSFHPKAKRVSMSFHPKLKKADYR